MALNIPTFLSDLISQTNPDAVYISNLYGGHYLYCSPIDTMLGYDAELLMKEDGVQFLTSLIHPDDIERVIKAYYEMIEKVKPYQDNEDIITHASRYRMRHKSGEWKWVESHDTPIEFDENGKIKYIFGLVYDKSRVQKGLQPMQSSQVSPQELINALKLIHIHKTDLFTRRKLDIIRLSVSGDTNKEIAHKLSISQQTVKNYKYQMFRKAGVKNMVELAVISRESGL